MSVLHAAAEAALSLALAAIGAPPLQMRLAPCPRPDLGDVATGVALQLARPLKRAPMDIAAQLAGSLARLNGVQKVEVSPPGYLNLTFSDEAISSALEGQLRDTRLGIPQAAARERIVVDYGGPNIKPMHVGHMRSLVIGEALRRMLLAVGHDVVSDIHLGDWGLPSGMILAEIRRRHPAAPWFAPEAQGPFPGTPPVDPNDLALLYPVAAAACKADPTRMDEARAITAALQAGDPGLSALWTAVVAVAKARILATCSRLGAHFDLTLGESDAQPEIPALLARIEGAGLARRDMAALVMDLALPSDNKTVPPLVLAKQDGSALYATTDLATIVMRRRDLQADRILYVVDARQGLHFTQVFRAAVAAGLSAAADLEHIGFGTVNGQDGKPFRTRDGGTMPLNALLDMAVEKARERLIAGERLGGASAVELGDAADAIGMAALTIGDLASHRTSGYMLDVDRALAFEGRTGPHLLYAVVRLRAILEKVSAPGGPLIFGGPAERRLGLACLEFGGAVSRAVAGRVPHELVGWAFDTVAEVGRFYAECPVAAEADPAIRASRITLCRVAEQALSAALGLLGCRIPAGM